MACGVNPNSPIDYWLSWDFIDGAVCFYGDQIGVTAFMLVFFGVTMLGLYNSTGSMMLPLIMAIALGPMLLFLIPSVGVNAIILVWSFGVSIGALWIWVRFG